MSAPDIVLVSLDHRSNGSSLKPKSMNLCYITNIVLIVLALLIVITGCILLGCYTSVSLAAVLICVGLVLLITSFISLKKIDRYIKQIPIEPKPDLTPPQSPTGSSEKLHIKHIFPKPEISIFKGNNSTDLIEKELMNLIYNEAQHDNSLSRKELDDYSFQVDSNKDSQYIYKINYASRNVNYEVGTSIYKRCQANSIANKVCLENNLDRLCIPNMHYMSIPLNQNITTLMYDISIEDKLDFKVDYEMQTCLYGNPFEDFQTTLQQLTKFICLTGCSSIDFNHIPIKDNRVYLLDLDIDLEVTDKRIEDGLFGTKAKRGLINCLKNKELIDLVLNTARTMGVNIDTERAQNAVENRLSHLEIQSQLKELYALGDLKPEAVLKIEDINDKDDLFNNCLLEISEEEKQHILNNLPTLTRVSKTPLINIEVVPDDDHPYEHSIFRISSNRNIIYRSFYNSGDLSKYDELKNINNKILNLYKTLLLMHKVVQEKNLDQIIIPKIKLIKFKNEGATYYFLALEDLPIIDDSIRLRWKYNVRNDKRNYKKTLMQLVELNASIGLNITKNNTFLLKGDDYKIALTNVTLEDPNTGFFGTHKVRDSGILQFVNSEQVLDELILTHAKKGYIDQKLATEQKTAALTWLNGLLRLNEFYDSSGITDDQLLNITPDDLKEFIDLDLIISTEGIPYFENKGLNQIPMREAVTDIIEKLNNILKSSIDDSFEDDSLGCKRFVVQEFSNWEGIRKYRNVYLNKKRKPYLCLHLVKEALIAKFLAFPNHFPSIFGRFDAIMLSLHL